MSLCFQRLLKGKVAVVWHNFAVTWMPFAPQRMLWLKQTFSFGWRKLVFINSTPFHHETRKTFLRDASRNNIMKMRKYFSFKLDYFTTQVPDWKRRFRLNLRVYWKIENTPSKQQSLHWPSKHKQQLKATICIFRFVNRTLLFSWQVLPSCSAAKTLNDKPSTFYDCWELNWGCKLP